MYTKFIKARLAAQYPPPSSLIGPFLVYRTEAPAPNADVVMEARESLPLEWTQILQDSKK